LNIIKTLAHTSRGAQSKTHFKIHNAFILSKLDYEATIFLSTKPTHLKILEPIHNTGIRLSIGAFRSSPIKSIQNIAGIPPLAARWEEQTSKLAARISRSPQDPMHHPKHFLRDAYTKYDIKNIIPFETSLCPPWNFSMHINLDLHRFPKNSTCPYIYRNLFKENFTLLILKLIYTRTPHSSKDVSEWLSYARMRRNHNSIETFKQLFNIYCRGSGSS